MKRTLIPFLAATLVTVSVGWSQQQAGGDEQERIVVFDELQIPREHSKQDIQPTVVNTFDFADEWAVLMPSDQGVATKKRVTARAKMDDTDSKYCLGIKCVSFNRGYNWVEIRPPAPIRLPLKTKAISVLAMGRNFRHRLVAWVRDSWGQEYRIEMGSLAFKGWRRLSAVIPNHVRHYSRYVPEYRPIYLTKFVIEFDPAEYAGEDYAFYFYLDRFEVARDVFREADYEDLLLDENGYELFDKEQWDPMKREEAGQGGGQQPQQGAGR